MTCTQALEALLEADPSDLAGQGGSPLAQHVRACARCRRLAAQVLDDTHLLASVELVPAVRPQPVRRRSWLPALVMPAALAAAIVAIILLQSREAGTNQVTTLTPVTVAGPSAPVPSHESPVTSHEAPQLGKAFPAPVPVAPVRFEKTPVIPGLPVTAMKVVAVTPPPGTRAAVLQTSDPKLVVVWLY
jgi:hypothetical protein